MTRLLPPLAASLLLALPLLLVDARGGQDPFDIEPRTPKIEKPALEEGIEPLTRGPIHEAFAQPIDFTPEPGEALREGPPDPVPEIPPDLKPEGDNVHWISGYWAWDPEAREYRWVSGVYRNFPEGRRWVPGHWVHTDEGWRFVPGFWAPEGMAEIPYAPEPPATLERGPSFPPPDANSIYVPGSWVYREYRFAWRPGFYRPFHDDCVWTAPRYIWSPNGYIFVDCYRDWDWNHRGVCFAPVAFHRPFWQDPLWCYRPSFVVQPNWFYDACFTHHGSNHYFYGNYFASARGFQPWFGEGARYDPYYQYQRVRNRDNPRWDADLRLAYADRAAGRRAGLPTSFQQQQELLARGEGGGKKFNRRDVEVLTSLNETAGEMKLGKLSAAQVETQRLAGERSRELAKARNLTEATGKSFPKAGKTDGRTLKLPAVETRVGGEGFKGKGPRLIEDTKGVLTLPPAKGPGTPGLGGPPKGEPGTGIPKKGPVGVPKIDSGNITPPRIETPRIDKDLPKKSFTPKNIDGPPKIETPKVETPKKSFTPKIIEGLPKDVSPPKVTPKNDVPKGPSPRIIDSPGKVETPKKSFTPKIIEGSPPGKGSPPPLPKVLDSPSKSPPPAPKLTAPPGSAPPAPRLTAPPKSTTPAPKLTAPPSSPPPRAIAPPSSPPARAITPPKASSPAPRISSPPPRPSTPAPRISAPSSPPRIMSPGPKGGGGGGKGKKGG